MNLFVTKTSTSRSATLELKVLQAVKICPHLKNAITPNQTLCAVVYHTPEADLRQKKYPEFTVEECDTVRHNCRVRLGWNSLKSLAEDPEVTCVASRPCQV